MATLSEAMATAVEHHQAGRLQAAEQIYRLILQAEPNHAEAIHHLGIIAHQLGRHELAVEQIRRAIGLNANVASFHCNLGGAYHALQRIPEAVACYRRAVELKPDFADAHYNLGAALKDQGKLDEAVACYRRVLQLRPDDTATYNNLGNALRDQGQLEEAVACCRRVLELQPDYAAAHYNLGNALRDQGKLDEAVACYRRAVELKPDFVDAHSNLGNLLKDLRKLDDAVACYRRALALKPAFAELHSNLGNALGDQGKLDEAVACYQQALQLKPDYAEAYTNLGNALQDQRKFDEAVACYRRTLELKPDYAEAHYNLGNALNDQGKSDEAVACYRRTLALKPDFADAYSSLGSALWRQGKLDEAVACCRRVLQLKPDFAEAYSNLGLLFCHRGTLDEAVACYRRALELKPDYADAHSNLLCALHYGAGVTPQALAEAHADYDRRHAAPLGGTFAPQETVRDRHGPLRLGFVSPDLGRHPVGYFLVRALENLRHEQPQTICYSDRTVKDDVTQRLQAAATQWRDVIGMSDQRLAEQIRADRIDILFDLAGHTGHNRLLVFARKPAAIQITWIGYEGTTGLAAMDYLLADRYVAPEGSQQYFRERLLWMPDGYLCYDPPAAATPVAPPPSLARGYATFGSFNNLAKITAEVVAVWAEILHRAPTARLVMKYRGLGDPSVKRRYLDLFAAHGVAPQRLELLPFGTYAEYLQAYQQVDLALDPFPFSGSATTCDALWMGVPVVTCPGATFASRHTLSHLSNIGLTDTIARDLHEYVELALALAADPSRLALLRAGLRQRMAASPLCDGKRFAANLMSTLRKAWQARTGLPLEEASR
jgi:predicted O-linked N-acetylglucosamine transferase (SPINDLY family)